MVDRLSEPKKAQAHPSQVDCATRTEKPGTEKYAALFWEQNEKRRTPPLPNPKSLGCTEPQRFLQAEARAFSTRCAPETKSHHHRRILVLKPWGGGKRAGKTATKTLWPFFGWVSFGFPFSTKGGCPATNQKLGQKPPCLKGAGDLASGE